MNYTFRDCRSKVNITGLLGDLGTNKQHCKLSQIQLFLAATKQLYDWFSPSVCLSVCLSVCHPLFTMFPSSYHHEIFRSYYQWQKWRPCKRSRSKVKVTEVNTHLNRFRTVNPVWIHIWWWNDAYSLMMLRRGALLFLAATKQLYDWFSPSVCLSVRPSHLFDHVPIIVSSWNFQELLPMTKVTSMQKVKVRGQRSRSQRSRPNLTVSGL